MDSVRLGISEELKPVREGDVTAVRRSAARLELRGGDARVRAGSVGRGLGQHRDGEGDGGERQRTTDH